MNKLELGACVNIYCETLGMLGNNVYVVDDGTTAVLIDPSCLPDKLQAYVDEVPIKPSAILITHYHFDHVGAAADLRAYLDVPVYASQIDGAIIAGESNPQDKPHRYKNCSIDVRLRDNQEFDVGTLHFRALLCPGHSAGSMCYLIKSTAAAGAQVLIAGDVLFPNSYGRTDLGSGNAHDMVETLVRLSALAPETVVLSGHVGQTTIGAETKTFACAKQGLLM